MRSLVEDFYSATEDGVLGVSHAQKVVFCNRAVEKMIGLRTESTVGRRCFDVIRCCGDPACLRCAPNCAAIRLARAGRPVPNRDVQIRDAAGQEKWLSMSTILVPPRWRPDVLIVHMVRDVDRSKKLENSLAQLRDELSRLVEKEAGGSASPDEASPDELTHREREILGCLADGASTREIADRLGISVSTVRNHVQHTLSKLGAHSRLAAVALALRLGLIETHV